jgi:AcrR family transcriptional regulator
MDLADERGIDAVTMRELGRFLGVEAASLYNHVAGKDDLLDGMVDLALSEIDSPGDDRDWRAAVRRRAISTRDLFTRHAWASNLIDSRAKTGPASLSYVDRMLGVLIGAGFSPARAADALLVLDSYIYGFQRQRSGLSQESGPDGMVAAREVLTAIPEGAYPNAMRVAMEYATAPFDHDAAFEFGLGLILDGLERSLNYPR